MYNEKLNGFQNEINITNYMNGKQIKSLDPNFRNLIFKLYGDINKDYFIHSKVDYEKKKYDLIVEINGVIKRISIKMGINNSVHVEGISSFIHFLIDSGVDRDAVIEYLKYHYADGTTNGTGRVRLSTEEYKKDNQDKIDYINSKINNPYVLERAINRFVLQGKNSNIQIDAILYGTETDFLFLTKEEVKKIIMNKKNMYSTGVHFGQLFCQPMTRCLNYNPKYEKKRYCVQIKWYSLFDDIMECMNNNVLNK